MAQDAASYAWRDFDRAVGLAAQFERTEIRMMAQVKLAQAILAGPPKRFSIMNGCYDDSIGATGDFIDNRIRNDYLPRRFTI